MPDEEMLARASEAVEAHMAAQDRRWFDFPEVDPVAAGFGEGPEGPIEVSYFRHSDAAAWVREDAKCRYEAEHPPVSPT